MECFTEKTIQQFGEFLAQSSAIKSITFGFVDEEAMKLLISVCKSLQKSNSLVKFEVKISINTRRETLEELCEILVSITTLKELKILDVIFYFSETATKKN